MLTNLETTLESLFDKIAQMPSEYVAEAEKAKDKERREKMRLEKLDLQKKAQEDRIQRALERAKAPVKKKTGKPVMFRSLPVQRRKKGRREVVKEDDEEEERRYFFEDS